VALTAPRGRVNLFGGLAKDDSKITIDANKVHYDEIFISGTSSSLPETNREALKLLSEKKVVAADFISHSIPLGKLEQGFGLIEQKRGLKVIVVP
jgi:L-iditol 2-dehydrogenase